MSTLTLRPNGAGDLTGIYGQYPWSTYHWDKVDEATSDDDATYVDGQDAGGHDSQDLYALPDHTTESGTINSVKVYVNTRAPGSSPHSATLIKTNATVYTGTHTATGTSYALISTTYTTNPNTTSAWTWAEIDALQAGVLLDYVAPSYDAARCTQVYVEVDYTILPPVPTSLNIGDVFKEIDWAGSKINVGDAWKATRTVKVNIGDAWKRVYSSPAVLNEDATYILLESGTDDRIEVE
jgi:hypothetical protein